MSNLDYSKYWTKTEGETAGDILNKWVKQKPDETAIVYGNRRITWRQLDLLTGNLAANLLGLGMKKGDRLGIWGPNHPEVLIAWFAAVRVGIIAVPINSRYRKMELEYFVKDSGCKVLVTVDEFDNFNFFKAAKEIKEKFLTLEHVVVYGKDSNVKEPFISFDSLVNVAPTDLSVIEANKPVSSDELLILYTSGTTGVPKGVVHSHDSLLCNSKAFIKEVWYLTGEDVLLLAAPWAHMTGIEIFFNVAFLLGQKIILMESYDPFSFVDIIETEKVTWFTGVPTMYMLPIIKISELSKRELSSFKFGITVGYYAPPAQMKLFKETYGICLLQLMGSSEAGGVLMTRRDDPEEIAFNTIGRTLSNVKLKICDEKGDELPRGAVGELWFKGPSIFKYYWNKPDLTKKEKDGQGFWHSGDMGRIIDEQGNIQLVSRKKEIIMRGGFNIYPGEIEAFVMNMPEVNTAVLVSYPDNVLGEKTFLNIVVKEGSILDDEGVRARFGENLANYKKPDIIRIQTSPLPQLPSGKMDKLTVRVNLLKEMGLEDRAL
ncbi:MAG: acyl--CoA ligase [Desulfobacterium sp.]|nr:acyl--CoA ligase [Desulfobacterium sp.]MBU3949986.1 acyl--CoA ligase [Pseudomonadota bacterium]MBU4036278.1 acyl--CoA ligase [Pseudomonadota bacterium]